MWFQCLMFFAMLGVYYCLAEYYLDDISCTLSSKNNSGVIDLSSAHNVDEESNPDYVVVINMCQRCKRQRDCPKGSLVCLIEKNGGKIHDIGSRITNISFDGSFYLSIQSKLGKSIIFISCGGTSSPPLVQSFDTESNTYYIMWQSTSACLQKHYKSVNKCTLYTPEQSFDLRPLQYSSDYIVKHSQSLEFVIAICKNVSHPRYPTSAVCNSYSRQPIANIEDYTLESIKSRGMSVSYTNTKGNGKTVIDLICSENATKPVINFVGEYKGHYFFNMITSVVCKSEKIECLIPDSERKYFYDLVNLHQFYNYQHNFENGEKIIFNICGFINYIPHIPCTGQKYFACIIDEQNKTVAFANYNMEPQFLAPGNISLVFTGKQPANQEKFILNITIQCSNHDYKQPDVEKINSSFYRAHWKSGVACPSKVDIGKDCKVKNLYTNSSIDLNKIHRKDKDYFVEHQDESFRINICGNLNQSCAQNTEASVCYKNKYGKELTIGEIGKMESTFKDGQFRFLLEGEPCNERVTRSKVTIILSCDLSEDRSHNETSYSSDPDFFDKTDDCEFYFHWRTSIICKEHDSSNCLLKEGNKLFDLSSLKNVKENYVVILNSSTEIVLNVCHSVLENYRMRCQPGSGVCLINNSVDYILSKDYDEKKKYESLGTVNRNGSDLEYLNGSLRLAYKNGGICGQDINSGSHETFINFICNETAHNTEPVFKGRKKCEYIFEWTTNAACSIGSPDTTPITTVSPEVIDRKKDITSKPFDQDIIPPKPKSKEDADKNQSCIAIEPETNKKFDLSVLMFRTWAVIDKDVNITIAVCRPINNSFCSKNSGACSYEIDHNKKYGIGYTDIGDYNTNLTYEQGSLFLQYRTSPHILTKIEFVCSMMDLSPIFIKKKNLEEGFITYISWPNQLACNKDVEVDCCQNIKTLCDRYNGTYQVNIDGKRSAFLSICRPVIPKTGLHCTNNTPACIGDSDSDGSFSNEKILGLVHKPSVHTDESIILEYISGSVCNLSSKSKYSTLIRFFCHESTSDIYPELNSVDEKNCKFSFDWGTPLLCSENKLKKAKNCTFLGKTFFKDELQVDILIGTNGTYSLNLCGYSPKCKSSLCKSTGNSSWYRFAEKNNTNFIQDGLHSKMVITYLSSDKNRFNKCGAVVVILCDKNFSSFQDPLLRKETDCFIDVLIKHKAVCLEPLQIQENHPLQEGSSSWVWLVVLSLLLIVSIVLVYIWQRRRREGRLPSIHRIFRYKRDMDNESLQL